MRSNSDSYVYRRIVHARDEHLFWLGAICKSTNISIGVKILSMKWTAFKKSPSGKYCQRVWHESIFWGIVTEWSDKCHKYGIFLNLHCLNNLADRGGRISSECNKNSSFMVKIWQFLSVSFESFFWTRPIDLSDSFYHCGVSKCKQMQENQRYQQISRGYYRSTSLPVEIQCEILLIHFKKQISKYA
jgi:hypothetical protein